MNFKKSLASFLYPLTLVLNISSLIAFIYTKLSFLFIANNLQVEPGLNIIIFSKDRPLQIQSLLSSFYHYNTDSHVNSYASIYVVFKCSSPLYFSGYNTIIQEFSGYNIKWINQGGLSLKTCLLSLPINRRKYTTTLVDDIIFRYPFSLYKIFSLLDSHTLFYLRLGFEIKNSLMQKNDEYFQPHFKQINLNETIFLTWKKSIFDTHKSEWFYLLTLDGLVCNTYYWEAVFSILSYSNPSNLEAELQKFKFVLPFFNYKCTNNASMVNLPFNLVQNTFSKNINAGFSSEFFLNLFNQQYILDFEQVNNLVFVSTHHICDPFSLYTYKYND